MKDPEKDPENERLIYEIALTLIEGVETAIFLLCGLAVFVLIMLVW